MAVCSEVCDVNVSEVRKVKGCLRALRLRLFRFRQLPALVRLPLGRGRSTTRPSHDPAGRHMTPSRAAFFFVSSSVDAKSSGASVSLHCPMIQIAQIMRPAGGGKGEGWQWPRGEGRCSVPEGAPGPDARRGAARPVP